MKVPSYTRVRTAVLFVVGVGGIIWETVHENTDRPALLILFLMLCGFPLVLNLDNLIRVEPPKLATSPVQPPPVTLPITPAQTLPVEESAP